LHGVLVGDGRDTCTIGAFDKRRAAGMIVVVELEACLMVLVEPQALVVAQLMLVRL